VDSAVLTVLINSGVAGAVLVLLILGLLVPKWVYRRLEQENKHLREALELERQRNGEMASTTGVTNQLIGALVDLAQERRPRERDALEPAGEGDKPGLTWRDLA
jgi:hypothetical protein